MKNVKLGDVCELYQPKTLSKKDLIATGRYLVYGANGVIGRYNHYNHEHSEVLMTCRGATCGEITITEPKSWINGNAMVCRPKNVNELDKKFLALQLKSVDKSEVITGSAQPQITRQTLSPLAIKITGIENQRNIVIKLDRAFEKIDRAIELTQKNLENSQNLFSSTLKNLLEASDGEELCLADFLVLHYGKALDRDERNVDGKFNVYGANGIKAKSDTFLYEEPSIIVGRKGSAGEINLSEGPFWPLDVTYYVEHASNRTNLMFLFYLLKTLDLTKLAKGVKPGINRNDVYAITAKLPNLSDQIKIVEKLESLSEKTNKLEKLYRLKLENFSSLKQSMLEEAFKMSSGV
jgi:type I restriction enzyme S subunit